jgi:hypothetical protein
MSGAKLMFICPVLGYIKKWIPVLGVSRIPAAAAMSMVSTPLMLSFSKVKSLLFLFLAPTLGFFQVPDLEWNNHMHSDAFKKSSVFMLRY